jgi:nucleotide-binding universal stress UspA family protein
MLLRHLVAATDESEAGRQAVRAAVDLASRCSARVTALRVVAIEAAPRFAGVGEGTGMVATGTTEPELERLGRWLAGGVFTGQESQSVGLGVTFGIPGVEICRYADEARADLVVLGRKHHSRMMRLLLGDTADAVARRNRIPTLFVHQGTVRIRKLLVALDGSERGMGVLREACDFARQVGASLEAVTVEPTPAGEPPHLANGIPLARTLSLQHQLASAAGGLGEIPLTIRRGDIVEEVMGAVSETAADLLVIGYHRGGPPGVLEGGSSARRMAHAAHCAVLTIPL